MILTVSTGTGVAMLLGMLNDQAAKILAGCPAGACRRLLQGVTAAWPDKAAAMLLALPDADATRVVGYLKPDTAAAILTAASPDDAVRILDGTGVRTAARIMAKMPNLSERPGGGRRPRQGGHGTAW